MKRTHNNGELRITDQGKTVILQGWLAKKRDLGGLIFFDLRDRYGITQCVIHPESPLYDLAATLKSEFVLEVSGRVVERSNKNKQIPTGDIEVNLEDCLVLSKSKQPPIYIKDDTDALEETRLKYRYLDLRRPSLQQNFIIRHKAAQAVREFLNSEDFIEFETPILTKSTPEGARDYVVPSRMYKREYFALPQSPQLFKQLLMISGFEKYYQIAKCFRDEDLRSDRQPEFTQIDMEMSFVDQEDVLDTSERLIKHVMKKVKGLEFNEPFPRMTYSEAMDTYGTDKPDTRYDMKLIDMTTLASQTNFNVFTANIKQGGIVKGINVKNGSTEYSRKQIDAFTEDAKSLGAKGLAFLKYTAKGFSGGIKKFFTAEQLKQLTTLFHIEENDLLLIVSDQKPVVLQVLGTLRKTIANDLGLYSNDEFDFTWVIDWPMFEYREEQKRYYSLHHPFTMVKKQYIDSMKEKPLEALAYCYDLVVQGQELGGGSIRIHNEVVQQDVFSILGISQEEQQEKFGFLTDALQYGTPPHGGIAFGFDRFIMLLVGTQNIRDVVAFPKTNSTQCLLTDAPSPIADEQLDELGLKETK